jgi:hypothetical protein
MDHHTLAQCGIARDTRLRAWADAEAKATTAAARAEADAKARTDSEVKTTAAAARAAAEAKAMPAVGAAAKAAVPTIARRAGDGAAMLRVLDKAMQFFAPQAKRALAACFLHLPVDQEEDDDDDDEEAEDDEEADDDERTPLHDDGYAVQLTISVEAVGSGIVIVPALQVDQDTTVGALKALIEGRCVPVSSWDIRLFVGHGGEELIELADDLQSLRAAAVADGATLVLVRFFARKTLLRLFEATNGGQWWHKRGWGPSSAALLSAWEGVECNGVGDVVTLKLARNKLQGACMQGAKHVR